MKQRFVAAALVGLLAGCVTTPPTAVADPPPSLPDEHAEHSYRKILARYSDSREVYDGFDTRLFAAVTLQTVPFREARVHRQAAFQQLPAPKVEQLIAEEREKATQSHEFFMGVHFNDAAYADFDYKHTIWRLALVTPAGEVTPSRIRRLGRVNLQTRAYYPYTSIFWVGWEVQFPTQMSDGRPVIPPGTEKVTFRMASSLGKAEMTVSAQ
ncbi:putative lipoprotein [Myxococcus hansupus]|uniref:Putative lipoprotein n=1 Tax=Pseudomyxococcus hansupus TaxID=1297742 RepID=A0A0H4WVJ7_9BACT|nr:hypothetical protein [Myxococcus hansupus]AKQ65355.1 putative lipoprotein [Myxococcus hansupus]